MLDIRLLPCLAFAALVVVEGVQYAKRSIWPQSIALRLDSETQAEDDIILSIAIEEKKYSDASLSLDTLFEERVTPHSVYGAALLLLLNTLLAVRSFFVVRQLSISIWQVVLTSLLTFAVTLYSQISVLSKMYPFPSRVVLVSLYDATLVFTLLVDFRQARSVPDLQGIQFVAAAGACLALLHALINLRKPLTPTNRLFAPTANLELRGNSLLSISFFTFLNSYLAQSAKGIINITELRPDANCATALNDFRTLSANMPGRSFKWRLLMYLKDDLLRQQLLGAVAAFFSITQPLFLQRILLYLTDRSSTTLDMAILYAVGMTAFNILDCVNNNWALFMGRQMSVKIRAVLNGELFTKTLRRQDLSKTPSTIDPDQGTSSSGKITNLVSSDVIKISETVCYLYFFFPTGVIILSVGIVLLFRVVGIAALAGLIVLIAQMPVVSLAGWLYGKFSAQVLLAGDQRLHLTQEIIQAIRVVKSFAWQASFLERLNEKREIELKWLKRRLAMQVLFVCSFLCGSLLVSLATFWAHTVLLGKTLDAATAFTALSLFNMIRGPLDSFASMAVDILSSNISLNRVIGYLEEAETEKWNYLRQSSTKYSKIGFENALFSWQADMDGVSAETFELGPLNLEFPPEALSIVCGSVGAGKSTLLMSLLGETNLVSGKIHLPTPLFRKNSSSFKLADSVSYCSQTPYLLSDSIRNNILFGSPFEPARYHNVLEACALLPDLKALDAGDETEVGERGTVLSGGQKARIALARAIYSNARTVLLDDVIAAVDAHTAQHLVNSLTGPLLQGRTCILVTHALALFLPVCQHVVLLDQGKVVISGDPKTAGSILQISQIPGVDKASEPHTARVKVGNDAEPLNTSLETRNKKVRKNEETQQHGAVPKRIYLQYAKDLGSAFMLSSIIVIFVLSQAVEISTNAWLRRWAAASSTKSSFANSDRFFLFDTTSMHALFTPLQFFYGYLFLASLTMVLFIIRTWWLLSRGLAAARLIYDRLITKVLGAKVKFFDVTPVGRIVNRLSRDTKVIDESLSDRLNYFCLEVVWTAGIVCAVAYNVPIVLLLVSCISIYFYRATSTYLNGARELRRTESVTRSPIFSLFGETYVGITTIRAFSDSARFLKKNFDLQNANAKPYYNLWLANRWLAMQTDLVGSSFVFCTACVLIISPSTTASFAGFTLTYALSLQDRILWLSRLTAEIEIDANSLERIQEYTDLEQEKADGFVPTSNWPSEQASIEINNLTVRYGEEHEPVLKNLTFKIEPKQKIAVVGRTGSGKSTLANSFFRFVEPENGSIIIDGVDINKMALDSLRKSLTIIPQDAILFSGTIRFNLDPFNEHDDITLWDILRRVKLITQTPAASRTASRNQSRAPSRTPSKTNLVASADGESDSETLVEEEGKILIRSLEQEVTEGGQNFSAGQRQLLALARGILKLKFSRILILDEASASLDAKTDEQIQQVIRNEMMDATLICIAHRLSTIIDYDRVLVMGDGQVLEYDTPANLLADDNSHFTALCKNGGDAEYRKLLGMVKHVVEA